VLVQRSPQLVDEWQLDATGVWNFIRSEVNRRQKPGQFILTGSAVSDDDTHRHRGAGRFARVTMRPMSLFESRDSTGEMSLAALLAGDRPSARPTPLRVSDIAGLVVRGGWPLNLAMSLDDAAQANIDYLRSITEVDIPRVDAARQDPTIGRRLLQALARNIGMEKKVARLSRDVDGEMLARTTVYDYLTALTRLARFRGAAAVVNAPAVPRDAANGSPNPLGRPIIGCGCSRGRPGPSSQGT
jgi:uncharacterized protein